MKRIICTGIILQVVTVLSLGLSPATRAQSPAERPSVEKSDTTAALSSRVRWVRTGENLHEYALWGGYSFDSFRMLGKTSNATLSLMGARYNRKLLTAGSALLEYTAEMSFYASYSFPETRSGVRREETATVSGIGLNPLGFQLNFRNNKPVQPFFKSTAGMMFFTRPFPDTRGTRSNFTFGVGGGLEFSLTAQSSFSLGYTFFHLSNGETGQINPGVDSSLFFGAFTFY